MSLKVLAAAAVLALAGAAAQAAPIYATGYNNLTVGSPTPNRDNPDNALGAPDGLFYEIGLGGTIDLTFGTLFRGPATLLEVTFNVNRLFDEDTELYGVRRGVATLLAAFTNDDIGEDGVFQVAFGGVYDELRFVDNSLLGPDRGRLVDGIDIDAVSVAPIPLPAAGLLLAAALGALAVVRRRA